MADRTPATPGRRIRTAPTRRLSPTVLLAVALPLATVLVLALVAPAAERLQDRAPTEAPLSRTTLVCPRAVGTDTVGVAHIDPTLSGELRQLLPRQGNVPLREGRVTELDTGAREGAVALVATDRLAAGPLAGRWDPAGAVGCTTPTPEAWFTGVGAGAERRSVLELVNPDAGAAVADVTVLGSTGELDVPRLRGVRVPGRSSVVLDLGEVVPTRDELAVQVQVARGRLVADVLDVADPIGQGPVSRSRVPSQPRPLTTSYLPGLSADGDAVLAVANPGPDEARVSLEVVTDRSTFAPAAAEDVRVAPGTVEVVDLADVLGAGSATDATGLLVTSSVPVTASARAQTGSDTLHVATAPVLDDRSGLVLPRGPKELVLAGATALGTADVTGRDEAGRVVLDERVELDPGRSTTVDLPDDLQVLVVDLAKTTAVGAVRLEEPGVSVVPLPDLRLTGLVPHVEPALERDAGRVAAQSSASPGR